MDVSRETQDRLKAYEALLRKWQKAVNLVSPTTLENAWERHFVDSLQVLDCLPPCREETGKVVFCDLGSGAGFPGMVLAIARPDIEAHLVESDSKKCAFLQTVSRETSTPVIVHNERIESLDSCLCRDDGSLILPDFITARALASLEQLLSWCLPWAEKNPAMTMVFLKGEKAPEEIAAARKRFSFSCDGRESKTDSGGRILILRDLTKKEA
ncbi:MAG: 16S rRNA (guanine(527)-N(7))-methyltransferase RsmG [Alphaproteobacteria bacterium]|nr:16S rRNA (guanine(527)-N(7))-methyltransferase RsmG [Alphaproteobacteria bacterium]